MSEMRDSIVNPVDKAMTQELHAGTWWRFDGSYEIYRIGDSGERFVRAPMGAWRQRQPEDKYRPLLDYSNGRLFLRFSRLGDDGLDREPLDSYKNAAAALQWADDYGVLGLTPSKKRGAWWGDPRGGPKDTVSAFALEAWAAHETLRLYAAATRPGGVDVGTIASFAPPRDRDFYTASPGEARDWAMGKAAANIQARVARYAYPQLYQRKTRTFVEGYDFSNLCGALWLQALWLLAADDVRRCEWCNEILPYEEPEKPSDQKKGERKPYKTRVDKEHCDNTCVQAARRARNA